MLFNSFSYAIFLPIVFILYWLMPLKYRWILLLASSYYFYMSWNAKYILLILFTTAVSFAAGILIEKYNSSKNKKIILSSAAGLCLIVLFFFKYFNFAANSLSKFLSIFSIHMNAVTLNLLLPVGISFYTFQTLSYIIDVYRGRIKAERHFGYYAAFVSFFPQLVAGPIERTENLLNQIKAEHNFNYEQATYGLKLMAWGYFKKLVISDNLSEYVSAVYNSPQGIEGFALILATLFFTIQIYCDFSGYSDIAIGTAKLFGINLMTNFKSPYFSNSLKELWSRWHISLTTWFRDYVYIPLGGSKTGKVRHYINLLVTFLASGLWHGANWTYVVWGAMHGVGQIFENIINKIFKIEPNKNRANKLLCTLITFTYFTFTLIFFASDSMSDALYIIRNLFIGISNPISYVLNGFYDIGMSKSELLTVAVMICILTAYDYVSIKKDVIVLIKSKSFIIRWIIYIGLGLIIVFFSQKGVAEEFVYFQF